MVIIFLTAFGLIMIYSSSAYNAQVSGQPSTYYMIRQGGIAVVGFIMMLIISKIDYHSFMKFAVPAVVVSYICEFLVTFTPLGIAVNGKKKMAGNKISAFPACRARKDRDDPVSCGRHHETWKTDQ